MAIHDAHGRPLGTLRLSVTDRCNLRCGYCMPEAEYRWLPREELLGFEELARLTRLFAELGARRVRITGGEPLLRRDLPELVEMLAGIEAVDELALTTNGLLLAARASALRRAGLARVTVSLDSLDRERFVAISRRDELHRVLAGIDAAVAAGFPPPKLDTVVVRGMNEGELSRLIDYAATFGGEVRFIEYMDVGGATRWRQDLLVSRAEMLAAIERERGPAMPLPGRGAAPAERFRLPDGTVFGIIASMTMPFCGACDRSRVTADGRWFHCLYASAGVDLRTALRAGESDDDLRRRLVEGWQRRSDRGAEARATLPSRSPLVPASALRRNPHLEMHTRGG